MSRSIFTSLYESGKPFALIDTRERRDYVNGHWFGSTNIPLSVLAQQITRMVPVRDFPIHLLDWHDKLSDAASEQLLRLGYSNVNRCKTNAPDIFDHGYVKGEFVWSKAFGEVVAHTCGLPEITPADYLAHHKKAHLFDVRPTAEYSQFTIPGSQSLPNSLLLANMDRLEQSGEMALLHCAGRTRSIIGACTLKAAGYQGPFAIFKGGTQAWQLDGFEREFDATRSFAAETDNVTPAIDFLIKWRIPYQAIDNSDLSALVSSNEQALRFDVSDDAATGQSAQHGIVKISGTNLIQQSDRSIACYHLPVILFDNGSGSRAAFAAYWLTAMGFTVSVVFLKDKLASAQSVDQKHIKTDTTFTVLSTHQLLEHRDTKSKIVDVRPSRDYDQGHLAGSRWANISEILFDDAPEHVAIVVVSSSIAHATDTAHLLKAYGWQISGIYDWNTNNIGQADLQSDTVDSPIDQSALFAGRHHGNMQDSQDYLAWEEALPEQIDESILNRWHHLLNRTAISQ